MNKVGDLQVWRMPQVPMKAFYVPVASVAEGVKVMSVLADYDAFQFLARIKPDYCNAGGLQVWEADSNGEGPGWVDWYDEESDEDDPEVWLRRQQEQRQ